MSGNADVSILPSATPVEITSAAADDPQSGITLCLSGGGYRAMLYHVGSLWRLNEFGILRSLRVRQLIDAYRHGRRLGAYWGIRGDAENTGVPGALACPLAKTAVLADTPTRLAELSDATQQRLINWRYASCDVALRRFVDPALPAPHDFPYPAEGVG